MDLGSLGTGDYPLRPPSPSLATNSFFPSSSSSSTPLFPSLTLSELGESGEEERMSGYYQQPRFVIVTILFTNSVTWHHCQFPSHGIMTSLSKI